MVSRKLLKELTLLGLKHVNDVQNLITPLHDLGINHFSYSQYSNKDRIVLLSSNFEFMQNYEQKITSYKEQSFTENQSISCSGLSLLSPQNLIFSSSDIFNKVDKKTLENKSEIHRDQIKFGMKSWVVIKNYNIYSGESEMYWFYSPFEKEKGVRDLFNHLPSLHLYSLHFKSRTKKLIEKIKASNKKFDNNSAVLDKKEDFYLNNKVICKNTVQLELDIKRYYLGYPFSENYLSRRELECLKLFFIGMTAKQISRELGISYRTVEKHMENISHKADICHYHELRQKLFYCQSFIGMFSYLK